MSLVLFLGPGHLVPLLSWEVSGYTGWIGLLAMPVPSTCLSSTDATVSLGATSSSCQQNVDLFYWCDTLSPKWPYIAVVSHDGSRYS